MFRTRLEGVLQKQLEVFQDHRGAFVELFNEDCWAYTIRFVQDDVSISEKGVLRGIHGDSATWKLACCLHGLLYAVVVDCRKEKNTFGQWQSFVLVGPEVGIPQQLLIPPNFGLGHLVLSNQAIFHYKQSTSYGEYPQFTYRWDDPRFGISWPISNPILSERDKRGAAL